MRLRGLACTMVFNTLRAFRPLRRFGGHVGVRAVSGGGGRGSGRWQFPAAVPAAAVCSSAAALADEEQPERRWDGVLDTATNSERRWDGVLDKAT